MMVLAQFANSGRLIEAARGAARKEFRVIEAFTPYPVEELAGLLPDRPGPIRVAMFVGGMAMAAIAYGLEYYSAVINYPYNSGSRPLNSWPAFMLAPFATGILVASVCGFIAFLLRTGLPRLHHPLFAVPGFERVSQDQFVLALEPATTAERRREMVDWLRGFGAVAIREVDA